MFHVLDGPTETLSLHFRPRKARYFSAIAKTIEYINSMKTAKNHNAKKMSFEKSQNEIIPFLIFGEKIRVNG